MPTLCAKCRLRFTLLIPALSRSHSWFETSAKTNHNIEESVRALVSNIMTHQGAFEAQRISAVAAAGVPGKVALDKEVPPEAPAAKSGCC